jgi:hypothetical protein
MSKELFVIAAFVLLMGLLAFAAVSGPSWDEQCANYAYDHNLPCREGTAHWDDDECECAVPGGGEMDFHPPDLDWLRYLAD